MNQKQRLRKEAEGKRAAEEKIAKLKEQVLKQYETEVTKNS